MMELGVVSSFDVLAALSTHDRAFLRSVSTRMRFSARARVFNQGELSRHFYILESGCVRVFYHGPNGRELTIGYCYPGDLFGLAELASDNRRIASAETVAQSVVWSIRNVDLDRIIRTLPALARRIVDALSLRLRSVGLLLQSVMTLPVRLRVAKFLLACAQLEPARRSPVAKGGWTHEDIANMLGCTRQTVTEALNEFERSGLVHVERKRIVVVDAAGLERMLTTAFEDEYGDEPLGPIRASDLGRGRGRSSVG